MIKISVKPNKSLADKILEKVPPVITWMVIFFPIIGSFLMPEVVAVFVLVFNVFFLYRSIAFTVQFILSLIKLRAASQVNWQAKVEGLDNIQGEIVRLQDAKATIKKIDFTSSNFDLPRLKPSKIVNGKISLSKDVSKLPKLFQKVVFRLEKRKIINYINNEIDKLLELQEMNLISYKELNHVIVIPHAKEPYGVLDQTLKQLSQSTFPTKQISIVLGAEARDPEGYTKSIKLQEKYKNVFGHIWVSTHVLGKDEIIGKSSNMAAAGKEAYKQIMKLGWDLRKTTVTSCDADSKLPPEYFSYLSYEFITHEDREYKFYTGAILLYANIWRIDFIARVRNSLSSIYNVGKLVRPDKFVPFSTYSTSMWLVKEVGFWTPWITPEDFHLFFKSSFHFPHKVSTIPLFTKIMVDAAEGDGHIDTFKNNYYQSRRWQWGVSDDGWVLKHLIINFGRLPVIVYYRGFHVIFDHILAPTASFLIMIGANVPPLVNPRFANTVLGARLPGISSFIIRLTLVAFMISVFFDIFLRPKRDGANLLQKIMTPFEWVINPIVGFVLTSVPGLEAHTRLLFGKYLEYYVTKKKA
jgi:hypothetical protein